MGFEAVALNRSCRDDPSLGRLSATTTVERDIEGEFTVIAALAGSEEYFDHVAPIDP